jgi:hypothetical protein
MELDYQSQEVSSPARILFKDEFYFIRP